MFRNILTLLIILIFAACSSGLVEEVNNKPEIFPDYTDCTIPANIAPLNFKLIEKYQNAYVVLSCGNETWKVNANKKQFTFSQSKWKKMLNVAKGGAIKVELFAKNNNKWTKFSPFEWFVPNELIDSHIAYRLIEPGYQLWNQMGIYQRNLENYSQSVIMDNKQSGNNCMNCHSFCMQNPDKMLYHMRAKHAGTLIVDGKKVEKLNTKTNQTISNLVYPSWHPSGRFVAFSVNETHQAYHMNNNNRVEVYDNKSDVVVYDVEKNEIITNPLIFSDSCLETFPTFSPDGKTLYFCTSKAFEYPNEFAQVKYSLCAISFNPELKTFGTTVDTLYKACNKSVSFPRVSPNGKYLLYTLSDYGNFSIWHKEADLYMINLSTNEHYPLEKANSNDVESYHSWSSNSKWIVFSSRRIDGLYTHLYISYINEKGEAEKPFIVPQKNTQHYRKFMKSYNIPEFIVGQVKNRRNEFRLKATKKEGINVTFAAPK